VKRNTMLDFMKSEAGYRLAFCLPDKIDYGSITSLWGIIPNLSDDEITCDELAEEYEHILKLFWQLRDYRTGRFIDDRS
jgi:hypothetical protein